MELNGSQRFNKMGRKTRLCNVCGRICYGMKCKECTKIRGTAKLRIVSHVERDIIQECRMKECVDEFNLKNKHVKYTNKDLLQAMIVKLDYILEGQNR